MVFAILIYMIGSLVTPFILGFIGGAIPGPILTAVFTETLQSGLLKAFRIIFIGMFFETLIFLICLIGFTSLHIPELVFHLISLIGAGILIWLATGIWKIKKIDTAKRVHFSSWKIAAMILANGGFWIFVITVDIPRAINLGNQIPFGALIFLVLSEIGWLLSTGGIAFIFSRFRTWLSQPHIVPFAFKLCALAFVYFAITSLYQSILFFIK